MLTKWQTMANLLSLDESFAQNLGEELPGMPFSEASNTLNLSAFTGVAIIASLTGRNFENFQRQVLRMTTTISTASFGRSIEVGHLTEYFALSPLSFETSS